MSGISTRQILGYILMSVANKYLEALVIDVFVALLSAGGGTSGAEA